jgi:hypothetical protein
VRNPDIGVEDRRVEVVLEGEGLGHRSPVLADGGTSPPSSPGPDQRSNAQAIHSYRPDGRRTVVLRMKEDG